MRYYRFMLLVVATLMSHVAFGQESGEVHGARIELSSKELDLGELYTDDDKQQVRLSFRNVGDRPLVITEVRTSCSCTTVQYERRPIQPDEQSALTIIFDPKRAPEGALYRVIQLFSTSAAGVEHITLKANIVK